MGYNCFFPPPFLERATETDFHLEALLYDKAELTSSAYCVELLVNYKLQTQHDDTTSSLKKDSVLGSEGARGRGSKGSEREKRED